MSTNNITHGGGCIYYTKAHVLYASGQTMRSTDNGVTWTNLGPNATWCIYGDGTNLYTSKAWAGSVPLYVAKESKDTSWTPFGTQQFGDAPYALVRDTVNGIMYSSNWEAGLWAYKFPTTGVDNKPSLQANAKRNETRGIVVLTSDRLSQSLTAQRAYTIKGEIVSAQGKRNGSLIKIVRSETPRL